MCWTCSRPATPDRPARTAGRARPDEHGRRARPAHRSPTKPLPCPTASTPAPVEADLAVPDYDSLAASQVVPRLAMLSPDDLRAVLAYEQSHRHRQTILNRVAQLLEA